MSNDAICHRDPADADEVDRSAFNVAFYELGLRWHWDGATYRALAATGCERARVRAYIEAEQPHLLNAYDAESLADTVVQVKRRRREAMRACTSRTAPQFNWADARWGEVGN